MRAWKRNLVLRVIRRNFSDGRWFLSKEVTELCGLSSQATGMALRELWELGYVERERLYSRGSRYRYRQLVAPDVTTLRVRKRTRRRKSKRSKEVLVLRNIRKRR